MRVAVIGGGIAGLSTARELRRRGGSAVIFERDPVVGGRIETERFNGFALDSGAQSIVPYASELAHTISEELETSNLVEITAPLWVHEHLRVSKGGPRRNASPRYTYRNGLDELPRLLAEGLELRLNQNVTGIEANGDAFLVLDEEFDAVVTTVPLPQASVLLWGLGAHKSIAQGRYRACISVLFGYKLAPPQVPYHALVTEEESHPLQWLSIENAKSPSRAPKASTGLVAQLTPSFSRMAWNWPDERIAAEASGFISTLFGREWSRAEVSRVKRWKYSQPEAIVLFESVNHRGERLIVAGDGVIGGRVEYAFASGIRAARLLTEER